MADPQSDAVTSPIIMKVDAPDEENGENLENAANEHAEATSERKEAKICSPCISRPMMCTPRFTETNPFAAKPSFSLNKSVLRPSILLPNANTNNGKNPFTLNPSRLNPFLKVASESDNCDNPKDFNEGEQKQTTSNGDSVKFVPLVQSDNNVNESIVKSVTSSLAPVKTNPTFVFGQNLQDRVISDKSSEEPKPSTSLESNGTSEMLFSNVIKDNVKADLDLSKETKSLSESAREYEESRANKRKYEEVEIRTGEEGETNVLHLSCKLFAFDKNGSWQERGRGNLRLNDLEVDDGSAATYTQSRLVFRASGSLRVVLNTKIWAEMTIDQASSKSIRFTANDSNGDIKVFLVMANPDEIKHLFKQLEQRVQNEKERQKLKKPNFDELANAEEQAA